MDEYTKSQNGPCGNTNLLGLVLDGTVSDRKGKKKSKTPGLCVFGSDCLLEFVCLWYSLHVIDEPLYNNSYLTH